jgi:PAS domain S-box-containing protein
MHAEEGWHSSEELFQNALEFAPFGMCLTSLDGVFLRVNPTLSRMLGRQEEELLAMSWPSLTHPDDLAVSQSAERDLVDGKVPSVEFEKRYVHRDGNIIWVRVRDFLAKNSQGVSTGFVTHIEDITERRRAAEELRRAKEAAEGASLAKSEFLANMSHEIRTPMNGILGTTELALASELDAQQREWLGMAHDCAESLMAILNDILDLSKIESGRLELETEPLHIRREIQRAVNIVLPIASRKGLAVEAMVEPDVPECVLGDSVRLRQVLVNLLGNAVKFTRSGLVKVRARSESRGDALCLYFSVTDTGIGIPAAEQAAIFEPFRQADNSIVRSYGGTGLGLSICNRLVGLMGGQIGVESEYGAGSTFWFTVRMEHAQAADADELDSGPDERTAPAGRPLRILLAEDNGVNRMVVERLLAKHGHSVHAVENGRDAVAAAAGETYDVILMDVQMPVMDGLEATAAIRHMQSSTASRVPIIALTAHAMQGDRERFLASGMDAHVSKPIRIQELLNSIEGLVSSAQVRK